MFVTTEITIDFQRPRQNTMQVVQDDTTRKIRLILKSGGNDFNVSADLASGDSVVGAVAYLKSDGHGGVYDTTPDGDTAVQLVSGTVNQFDVLLVGQVFTAAGWTQVNIKFYNSDFSKVLSTFAIEVNVQKNAASDYESEDYSNMESLGAIRTEITEFESTVRAELAELKTNPTFAGDVVAGTIETSAITLRDPDGGATIYGGYDAENKPQLSLSDTGDNDLPVRLSNVATPQQNGDAANKEYVDARLTKHNPAATGTLTLTNNSNMLFFEVGSRTLSLFGDGHSGTVELGNLTSPNNNSSAATKGYVDTKLAALEARIAALEG